MAAADELRRGGIVVYPTETQYGLGVSAFDQTACERLRDLKGRIDEGRTDAPFLVIAAGNDAAWDLAREVPTAARTVAERCWPGPVTQLLPARDGLPAAVTGDDGSIAVRVPGDETARRLTGMAGFPVVSTSANLTGRDPLTDPVEVGRVFPDGLAGIVDGGILPPGPPSTLIDPRSLPLKVVREGAVSRNSLARLTGLEVDGGRAVPLVLFVCTGNTCRSPMAEGAFRALLRQNGLGDEFDVASAGVAAVNWGTAVAEARDAAWERGIDISGHRPRQLTARLTHEADIIVVMTEGHRQRVALLNPEAAERTFLLRKIGAELQGRQPIGTRDLDDPIGRPAAAYRRTLKTIQSELERGQAALVEQAADRRLRITEQQRAGSERGTRSPSADVEDDGA